LPRVPEPIFCYVTDRRAFAASSVPPGSALADAATLRVESLSDSIRCAVAAGIGWIQIREKDLDARALVDLARFAVAEARRKDALVMVNDRLDVALAADASGIHLGENSLPLELISEWRRSSERADFRIGVSCHSLESARSAEKGGADYVFFGPVFATPSKAVFGAAQGIERLREVCAAVSIPVLAIGGVNPGNARACLDAGARGIAAIRFFQNAQNSAELAAQLKTIKHHQ
jgi:thiamine-phosphate pyrophosphorylase